MSNNIKAFVLAALTFLPACLLAHHGYHDGYHHDNHWDNHDWHGYHDHYYYNNYYSPGAYYYSGYPSTYDIYPYYAPFYDTPSAGAGIQINLGN